MSELLDSRAATLRAIRKTLESADRFVFTLGLTESWRNKETGVTYAMCPGTLAGDYDSRLHEFHNTAYPEVEETLRETFDLLRAHNDGMRFLLTVSPVPLTATASSNHVLVASTYSKSVLRAVAGDLAMCREDTDYFPSYEIMSSPPFRGMFYEPNMRSIAKEGVDFVMGVFLKGVASDPMNRRPAKARDTRESPIQCSDTLSNEVVCEDQLLEAFGRRP